MHSLGLRSEPFLFSFAMIPESGEKGLHFKSKGNFIDFWLPVFISLIFALIIFLLYNQLLLHNF